MQQLTAGAAMMASGLPQPAADARRPRVAANSRASEALLLTDEQIAQMLGPRPGLTITTSASSFARASRRPFEHDAESQGQQPSPANDLPWDHAAALDHGPMLVLDTGTFVALSGERELSRVHRDIFPRATLFSDRDLTWLQEMVDDSPRQANAQPNPVFERNVTPPSEAAGLPQGAHFVGMARAFIEGTIGLSNGPLPDMLTLAHLMSAGVPLQTFFTDDMLERAAQQASEADAEAHFQAHFNRVHAGSVTALRQVVDAVRERDPAQVPPNGITRADIDTRDATVFHKLVSLLLMGILPELLNGNCLQGVSLFETHAQQPMPDGHQTYPSRLPAIIDHLRNMHGNDPQALRAAIVPLMSRMTHLVESEAEAMLPDERTLLNMLRDAPHRIDRHVLYTALGQAYAHLADEDATDAA